MNKKIFYIAISLVVVLFSSCNKEESTSGNEEEPTNKSFVIEASGIDVKGRDIVTVKAILSAVVPNKNGYSDFIDNEITSAKFENGGFKLILPDTVLNEYLGKILGIAEGVIVSNIYAKTGYVSIQGYDNAGESICSFNSRGNEWSFEYMYSDSNFTQKGNSFDCSFEKGWNIMYHRMVNNMIHTTQKPLDENFKWYMGVTELTSE